MMHNDNGFTLLEAVFAMGIFAVAMLGVIGLQMNAMQTDEETRRKDMAVQLLTEGAELVECSDYASDDLYDDSTDGNILSESALSNFVQTAAGYTGSEGDPDIWKSWGNEKVKVFFAYAQSFADHDNDNTMDTNEPEFKKIMLVASWRSLKTGQTKTLHRLMIKPENMLQ